MTSLPSSLQGRSRGSVIREHQRCPNCEYDLIGLVAGGVCPECGRPIVMHRPSGRFGDNLVDAPLNYLRHLRWALLLLAVVSIGAIVTVAAAWWTGQYAIVPVSMLGLTPAWAAGVWLTTWKRPSGLPRDSVLDHRKLRVALRVVHMLPIVAAGLIFAGYLTQMSTPVGLPLIAQVLLLAGLGIVLLCVVALVPLGVYLSALCDWAGDGGLSTRFRLASSVIALCTMTAVVMAMILVGSVGMRGMAALVLMWSVSVSGIATVGFLFFLLQLSHMATWAVNNAVTASERDARVSARREERIASLAARVPPPPKPSPSIPLASLSDDLPIPLAEPSVSDADDDLPGLPRI